MWEQPLRWLGLLRPSEFTIITKTLTLAPRAGNLRWWCPWRCVRLIPGGAVNAVGLTNPGLSTWVKRCYPGLGFKPIVSIQPENPLEAVRMVRTLEPLDIHGIELNLSCPNIHSLADPRSLIWAVRGYCGHPLLLKLAADQVHLIPRFDDYVDAYDLINTVPWGQLFPDQPSPLAGYGFESGVSGHPLRELARQALVKARRLTDKPILSGGGIDSLEECLERERLGAEAFSFGTLFLRRPWEPNRIVTRYRESKGGKRC